MNGPSHGYQPGPGFGLEQAATNGGGQVEAETNGGGEAGEGAKFSDINLILDQILTMSDQNIDEAQVAQTLPAKSVVGHFEDGVELNFVIAHTVKHLTFMNFNQTKIIIHSINLVQFHSGSEAHPELSPHEARSLLYPL